MCVITAEDVTTKLGRPNGFFKTKLGETGGGGDICSHLIKWVTAHFLVNYTLITIVIFVCFKHVHVILCICILSRSMPVINIKSNQGIKQI